MSDIVRRLRREAGSEFMRDAVPTIPPLLANAADEIKKLRADRDRWHKAAMDAGVVVLSNGSLSLPRDRGSL